MKRLFALCLAALMLLSLAACGGKEETPAKDAVQATDAPAEAPTEAPQPGLPSYTFSRFGDAKVTIVGAEFAKDDYGDDFLRIYYDYTNTSSMGCIPAYSLEFARVYQNGEEVDSTYIFSDDECAVPADRMADLELQPGMTTRCTATFACAPEGGVVEFGCNVMIGSWMYNESDLEWLEFTVDPADLLGVPEEMEYAPITEPTYAAGLPTSASFDTAVPFDISLDGYELTTYDEQPALRVCMTYTNTAEDTWTPSVVLPIAAYQDGIGLEWGDTWYLEDANEADEAFTTDLEPGQSVSCNAIFLLRNDSPVEVVIEESEDYPRVGLICDVTP